MGRDGSFRTNGSAAEIAAISEKQLFTGEAAVAVFPTRKSPETTIDFSWLAKFGGAERDRTADLLIANEALSQLSYGPPKNATASPVDARKWARAAI